MRREMLENNFFIQGQQCVFTQWSIIGGYYFLSNGQPEQCYTTKQNHVVESIKNDFKNKLMSSKFKTKSTINWLQNNIFGNS